MLDVLAGERKKEKKNWDQITKIKDLKNGYISQIVSQLAKIVVEKNAIIVLEDLNSGFKQGRVKVESSVYQKLETAIAKKFCFLVTKTAKQREMGSVVNAYQLVPPTNTYEDMKNKKQWGVMLYTNPAYTSKICPNCGFYAPMRLGFENVKKTQDFIRDNIKSIKCSDSDYIFAFSNKFGGWEINTNNATRVRFMKLGNCGYCKYDLGKCFRDLFKDRLDPDKDICNQLLDRKLESDKDLFKSFIFYLDLLLQIRNSANSEETGVIDYISCPNCGFDTRVNRGLLDEIDCGDANGAYNIARKGLIMVKKILNNENDLYVSNEEWFSVAKDWKGFCHSLQKQNG